VLPACNGALGKNLEYIIIIITFIRGCSLKEIGVHCTLLVGESILVCKPNERSAACTLARSELPPVKSCLFRGDDSGMLSSSMKRAILEVKIKYYVLVQFMRFITIL
jgi:hypothetical protein